MYYAKKLRSIILEVDFRMRFTQLDTPAISLLCMAGKVCSSPVKACNPVRVYHAKKLRSFILEADFRMRYTHLDLPTVSLLHCS